MKVCSLSDLLYFENILVECIGVIDGQKVLILKPVNAEPCVHCGNDGHFHVVENSQMFQSEASAVISIKE